MTKPHSPADGAAPASVERWDVFELSLTGPDERASGGNPFLDVRLSARFTHADREVATEGFYDGHGTYKLRLMPDEVGPWRFETTSNAPALSGLSGGFECAPAGSGNHGPVRVARRYHFAHADGTPHRSYGTTCYAWIHQERHLQEQTLATLRNAPFNKLRMCVFPKHYDFNHNEPEVHPFVKTAQGFDFSRFDPAFWRNLETRIGQLRGLGVEADVILFHPYDRWGFARMGRDADERYLRYAVARLAAYRNVWWSLANEYDLMRQRTLEDWDRDFQIVQRCDPSGHPRSIHNCREFYDHSQPWVTHCSVQSSELSRVGQWRERYGKPVVVDECCYEGDIHRDWGNISAQELVHRFWLGMTEGGYVGHGETFEHPRDVLWWSKGGVLHGQSPERIAFLRSVLDDAPAQAESHVDPKRHDRRFFGVEGQYHLSYMGVHQPRRRQLHYPPGKYRLEIIDTWGMSIQAVEGVFDADALVELPVRPYLALRARRV